jgi:malate dehydrogenase (oxaloacetate-decarboxylating)
MFRGALDARVTTFNETMLLAVASTLADLVPAKSLSGHCIIPSVFDPQVVPAVANAISQAARDTGVARPTALMGQPQSPNRYFNVNITDN